MKDENEILMCCGKEVDKEWIFCPYCKYELKGEMKLEDVNQV